jgi:hypothetical protein
MAGRPGTASRSFLTFLNETLAGAAVFIPGKHVKVGLWRNGFMKRAFAGLILMVVAGAGSLVAQDGYYTRGRDLRRDYADRRNDFRDIRRDEAKIAHDRYELREALREHDYRRAEHERRELRREYRDLREDRRDVYRDTRDIRRDQRGVYWYGR